MSIYDEIKAEREVQDKRWGGPAHDDNHLYVHWCGFICKQLGEITYAMNINVVRYCFVQVAALAIAAIESIDRQAAIASLETPDRSRR